MNGEALIPMVLFAGIAAVFIVYFNNQHRERMAMIEKGLSIADAKGTSLREMLKMNPLTSLKWGLLAFFIGIGLLLANYLESYYSVHDSIYVSMMFLFGGLALIIFYLFASGKMKQEEHR